MSEAGNQLALVKRAAAGETGALEKLIRQNRESLIRYIDRHMPTDIRRVVNPVDVLQDVYIEAFRSIRGFTPTDEDAFHRWLLTIARTRLTDAVRSHRAVKRGGRAGQATAAQDESMVLMLEELAVYERTPSKSAIAHEIAAAVSSAIARLPSDSGRALRLRYIEGLSVKDAAMRMSRSEGAFAVLCHRAMKMLRIEMRSASLYT